MNEDYWFDANVTARMLLVYEMQPLIDDSLIKDSRSAVSFEHAGAFSMYISLNLISYFLICSRLLPTPSEYKQS